MSQSLFVSIFNSIPLWAMVVPIGLCSVVLAGVVIERLMFYKKTDIDYRLVINSVEEYIGQKKYNEARSLCDRYGGPIINMIIYYLQRVNMHEDKELLVNDLAEKAVHSIGKFSGVVSTVATVSPMLGLLGTVTGMMKSFSTLASKGAAARDLLAQGITEALITTALGLMVAIPAIIFYNYMVSRTNFLGREVEYIANSLDNLSR